MKALTCRFTPLTLSLALILILLPGSVVIAKVSVTETPSSTSPGVPTMDQASRILETYKTLRATNLEILDGFYAKDAVFVDPLGEQKGLSAIKTYYANMYKNVQSIRFEKIEMISQKDRHCFRWKMHLQAKGLNGGKTVVVQGTSVLHFNSDNLVSFHQDYFDMGDFIYRHIPVLGWLVKKVNQQMEGH